MFKKTDGMRMEATPERVMAVCRLLAECSKEQSSFKGLSSDEIVSALTLEPADNSAAGTVKRAIAVAGDGEIGAITAKDGRYTLAAEPSDIATSAAFRRYVASRVLGRKDTAFVRFTSWILGQNEKIFGMGDWENISVSFKNSVQDAETGVANENSVLGWRFWAAFLGLGYLSGTMFLPNMKVRIQDLLATDFNLAFSYDTTVRAEEFIPWLSAHLPEVSLTKTLPLAVSSGLRTLENLGLVHMEDWQDSHHVKLYPVSGAPLNSFTHITVRKEVLG